MIGYGYLQQLAAGIAAKQDVKTGCWYQLLNYDDTYVATDYNSDFCYTSSPVANYLESSCTAIFIASYLKGMRLGLVLLNSLHGHGLHPPGAVDQNLRVYSEQPVQEIFIC